MWEILSPRLIAHDESWMAREIDINPRDVTFKQEDSSWLARRLPNSQCAMSRGEDKIVVGCQQHQIVTNAELRNHGVNSAYLQPTTTTSIIYADSNHGSQFQWPELFVSHTSLFLSE